jgi:hypothetical protein
MICQQFHWDEDIMWPELSFSRNHKIIWECYQFASRPVEHVPFQQ